MFSLFFAAAALLATPTAAAPSLPLGHSPTLAGRSIYFAVLDRFARAPNNTKMRLCARAVGSGAEALSPA